VSINQRETGQARLLTDSIALVSHVGFAEQRGDPIVDKWADDVECPKMADCCPMRIAGRELRRRWP